MFEQSCMRKIVKQNANRLLRPISLVECSVVSWQHWEKGRREVALDDSTALQNLMPEPETQQNKEPEHELSTAGKEIKLVDWVLNEQRQQCCSQWSWGAKKKQKRRITVTTQYISEVKNWHYSMRHFFPTCLQRVFHWF